MIRDLERLDDLARALVQRAGQAGVRLIWRAQSRSMRHVVVREGKPENSSASSVSGHGIQVITPQGWVALGNRDDFRIEPALELLERTIRIAANGAALELDRAPTPAWTPFRGHSVPDGLDAFDDVDLARAAVRLAELEREILERSGDVRLTLSFKAELDSWRIVRCDGTDVSFSMPRCAMSARATGDGEGRRHSVSASFFDRDPRLPWDEANSATFVRRALCAADLARRLPDAPPHPSGSFPLLIDYALAKGLAHEAFGHASEADGFRSSVLAKDGRFRKGERVGAEHVSIIDEPVENDHAWQPFSSNGVPRRRVVLVDHGRLHEALADGWSAAAGGVEPSGAGRSESFRNAPQPRMTNIRIEVDQPLPAPGAFEDYGPEQVQQLLRGSGIFDRHPTVVFLSGYNGGQVNTATGDFVFQCKAIYDLTRDTISLFKPAIFSGSMFGALKSVREAFGPLKLDAIGYCGKWGQSVPSSGGSHYFLMLDPDPTVRLGGR